MVESDVERDLPPRRRVAIGRALNQAVVRAPWLWPVLKHPIRRYFDEAAPEWDERTGAGGAEHLTAFAAGLLHVKPHPERALDIGTGTGEAALLLAREFPTARVRGVDMSEEMIALARAKVGLDPEGRIAFSVGDAAALSWDDDSFDLVTQLNMPPFFGEIARVLRPGGQALVAASWGPATPFFTSTAALDRGFRAHGITQVAAGSAGPGTFWVGRLRA